MSNDIISIIKKQKIIAICNKESDIDNNIVICIKKHFDNVEYFYNIDDVSTIAVGFSHRQLYYSKNINNKLYSLGIPCLNKTKDHVFNFIWNNKQDLIKKINQILVEKIGFQYIRSFIYRSLNPNKDLISVILPSYNDYDKIKYTLNSLYKQSYQRFELIIINDYLSQQSDDHIRTMIDKFKFFDKTLYIKNEINMGKYTSVNKAICNSHGEYITIIDTGDIYHPERLKMLLNSIHKNDKVYARGKYIRVPESEIIANGTDLFDSNVINTHKMLPEFIGFFKRRLFNVVGFYDNVRCSGDSEFLSRIEWNKLDGININKILYIGSPANLSSSMAKIKVPYITSYKSYYKNNNIDPFCIPLDNERRFNCDKENTFTLS